MAWDMGSSLLKAKRYTDVTYVYRIHVLPSEDIIERSDVDIYDDTVVQPVDLTEWYHLMTVNPSDGQHTWRFDSLLWYNGTKGVASDGKDYINNDVRFYPIDKIKIVSKNGAGKEATKVWELDSDHQGWTFYNLIRQSFSRVVSKAPEVEDVPSSGFNFDPIMAIGGKLKFN